MINLAYITPFTIAPTDAANAEREAWLLERRQYLGATDVGGILGLNPYATPLKIWHEKKGMKGPDESNEAMSAGIDLEPYVAARYARDSGKTLIKSRHYRHPEIEFFGANPDYEVEGSPDELVQIKTAGYWIGQTFGLTGSDECPDQYIAQCAWELFVTGKKICHLVVLIEGRNLRGPFTIDRSKPEVAELIEMMKLKAFQWWQTFMIGTNPPPLTEGDYDTDWVSRKRPDEAGDAIVFATPEIDDVCLALYHAREARIRAEKEEDALANQIKDFMGPSGVLESGYGRFTFRRNVDGVTVPWAKIKKRFCATCTSMIEVNSTHKDGARPFLTPWSRAKKVV